MSDSIANGYGCRPCKQVQLNVTDAIIHFVGDGSAFSHLNASNVDFGTLRTTVFPVSGVTAGTYGSSSNVSQVTVDKYGRVTSATNVAITSSQWTGAPGSPIYYIPGVGIGSSSPATANLQVTGNVYVSNSITTTNVITNNLFSLTGNVNVYGNIVSTGNIYATEYHGDGGLLSNISSDAITQPFANLAVSNSVTTTNIFAMSANIATMNVGYLTVDSAIVYGTSTLNVYGTSNLTNVTVTDTFNVNGSMTANAANATFFFDTFTIPYINTQYLNVASNIVLTGNLSAPLANITTLNVNYLTVNSAVVYGTSTLNVYGLSNLSTATMVGLTGQTTLNVTGNIYVSNAVTTGNIFVSNGLGVGPATLGTNVVVFSNISGGANTFVMDSNGRVSIGAVTQRGGSLLSFGQQSANKVVTLFDGNSADNPVLATNFYGFGRNTDTLRYQVNDTGGRHTFFGASTEYARITSTGVSIMTGANPTSNLQVTGNAYISNSLTTTNVFANTATFTGTTGRTTLNVTGNIFASNSVTTTNVYLNPGVTSSTAGNITRGAIEFNGTSSIFYGTPMDNIRGLIPVQYFYELQSDTTFGTTIQNTTVSAFPNLVNGVQLQNGKYYFKILYVLTIVTSLTAGNTSLNMQITGGSSAVSYSGCGVYSQNITTTSPSGFGTTVSSTPVNMIYFNGTSLERVSVVTTATNIATYYYTTLEGTFSITSPGGWYPVANIDSPGTFTATPGVRRGSFIYLQKIGDNSSDVNIGEWS